MESHAAICGLSFAFCFCNLLARVYKVDPFVLGAQPLDMSLLGLCWHNKCCFLLASETSIWAHNFPHYLGVQQGLREMVSYHLPLAPGCIPRTTGRRSHQVPMDSLIPRKDLSFQWVRAKASAAQRNPLRLKNQFRNTALCTGKNPGSNSGLPQKAEGESDHLPETTSNCLLGWNHVSLV
jgi:hypothetical protein